MIKESLSEYKKILPEIFNSVTLAIGNQVMLIVLDRALWKTKNKYPDATKIRFSEDGIFLDELDSIDPYMAIQIVQEFLVSIIGTLGKLLGTQIAEKLAEQLPAEKNEKTVD